MSKKNLAEKLAEYALSLRFENLGAETVHEVKRRMIDSLGCALGAWNTEPCRIARSLASKYPVKKWGATLWGARLQAPPDWAAFANGCLVRYLDYNDTYLSREPAHPSDNIPAAFAVAESIGSNGKDLILSIALAYEIQCRLCDAASLRSRGWDHVTYGVFSIALAAGRLMRLNHEKLKHAVGIAGVAGTALRQARIGELSHWKGCAFAHAARHGVFAALLAREGMTGPAPIFEGEMGFEKLVSGKLELRIRNSESRMILGTSIKFWPAEYHSQSAIEAALKIRRQILSSSAFSLQPKSLLIESHDAAVDIIGSEPEKWRPASRETADHSLPYITAVALLDGEVTAKQFSPGRFKDPKLLELVQKVRVKRSRELSALYPGAVGNKVTVRLKDGRKLMERVDHPRGHSRNPMSDREVESKFQSMAHPILGKKKTEALLRWIWKLDKVRNVREMGPLCEIPH